MFCGLSSASHQLLMETLCAGDSEFCILVSLCKHFCAQIAMGFACAQNCYNLSFAKELLPSETLEL
jgi:hypothetical protein